MPERKEKDRSIPQCQHEMKNEERRILNIEGADDGPEEIQGKQAFENGCPGYCPAQVLVLREAVANIFNIELGRSYEGRLFTHVTFNNRYRIVQGQPHRQREE